MGLAYYLAGSAACTRSTSAGRRPGGCRPKRSRAGTSGTAPHVLDERAPILQLAVTPECIDKAVKGLLAREAS
jgi:hypothetical protein